MELQQAGQNRKVASDTSTQNPSSETDRGKPISSSKHTGGNDKESSRDESESPARAKRAPRKESTESHPKSPQKDPPLPNEVIDIMKSDISEEGIEDDNASNKSKRKKSKRQQSASSSSRKTKKIPSPATIKPNNFAKMDLNTLTQYCNSGSTEPRKNINQQDLLIKYRQYAAFTDR